MDLNREQVIDIFEEISSEEEDRDTDNASYRLVTYGADYTLKGLIDKIKDKEIVIPLFQRKYVWPPKMASSLVESFLLGLPVPQIFLYKEEETQDLLVVDGQQRLKTILFFYEGAFPDQSEFYLRNVKSQWLGKKYVDLTEPDKKRFRDSVLRTTIFEQLDPKDNSSIFEVFKRLNTGGLSLTDQEIRNCIIRGNINNFLESLNGHKSWRYLYGKPDADPRMRDTELILRFFALYENGNDYHKPMKEFLTTFMRSKKMISLEEQGYYSKLFNNTMDFVYDKLGSSAFKLKAGLNAAAFDAISVALAKLDQDKITDVREKYNALKAKQSFLDSVSVHTTDGDQVDQRIRLAIETFSQ